MGNFVAVARVGFGKLPLAPVAHGLRQFCLESAEKRKWFRCAPFFAHEQKRWRRLQQQNGQGRGKRIGLGEYCQPLAQGPIADLVVVLQEIDEGARRQMPAWLAARTSAAVARRLTLVGKAL